MKKFDFPIRAVVDEAAETRVVGAIKIENEEVLVGFRQTIEYKLSPAYDGDGALVHFLLLPIPVEEKTPRLPTKDILRHDYRIASISEDDRGSIHITYAKDSKTLEQLERELELARYEIAELKDAAKKNELAYLNGWDASKRHMIQALENL